ncbi:MAG: hypothetical protein IJI46_02360 [Erysipelotrichaceae bacterium]|nr:hypothetical protein [Erysipelotrichaceae bacterium]
MSTREHMKNNIGSFGPYISTMYLFDILYSCLFRQDYQQYLKNKFETAKEYQNLRFSNNPILKDE